jgi:serine/threonine protein kinase
METKIFILQVLDASEDQARTQIGTPYYLSPEICESKPYGRKSDVWSLGVILFELLTLEMPFQATSLPALVHRICTTEPAYEKVNEYTVNKLSIDLIVHQYILNA